MHSTVDRFQATEETGLKSNKDCGLSKALDISSSSYFFFTNEARTFFSYVPDTSTGPTVLGILIFDMNLNRYFLLQEHGYCSSTEEILLLQYKYNISLICWIEFSERMDCPAAMLDR